MKANKNLRDHLANQSGMPTGMSGKPGAADGGLTHQIQLEKAKRKAAAAGGTEGGKGEPAKHITASKPPAAERHGPKGGPASGRGAPKSTTQQGLR
jgi:hypothetical protein